MNHSRIYGVSMLVLAIILMSFATVNCRAQDNWIYIYYIQTDKSVYEVGENVSITASYGIHFLETETLDEGFALTCSRGGQKIAGEQWSDYPDGPNGTYIRGMNCTLNPSEWYPNKNGEVGTASCSLFLDYIDYVYGETSVWQQAEVNFTVVRANQNCSLISINPSQPIGNDSSILLLFRLFNCNNPQFAVGFNSVNFSIANPEGLVTSNTTESNSSGYCSMSFSPSFNFGVYRVSLRSSENVDYQGGQFNYNLTVMKSPVPTSVNVTWEYCGAMYNASSSYALEPIRIKARLISLIDGSGIAYQGLSLFVNDASNSTVAQINEPTNSSGYSTCTFLIPHQGKFIARVLYSGLYGSWFSSCEQAPGYISAVARPISLTALNGNPTSLSLGKRYAARYLVLDAMSQKPVQNETFTARIKNYSLSNTTTDNNGVLNLVALIPRDRLDFVGNCTLTLEPLPSNPPIVYNCSVFSIPLFCKIPTTTTLDIPMGTILEEGEILSISARLSSLNSTPVSYQNLTFMILGGQEKSQLGVIYDETNDRGVSNISIETPTSGNLTIVAIFNGSIIFDASIGSCSVTVIPRFQERLPSYLLSSVLACLSALMAVIAVRKSRRKLKLNDLVMPLS
jgi:hypothetical protein